MGPDPKGKGPFRFSGWMQTYCVCCGSVQTHLLQQVLWSGRRDKRRWREAEPTGPLPLSLVTAIPEKGDVVDERQTTFPWQ